MIPAGGSGTRLWPLSRAAHPKFLHSLTGSPASMLQATVARLAPLASTDRTFIVTGSAHSAAVARQLPEIPVENLLIEPSPRDSCAAIGLAAAVISRRDPTAIMGSFAADHLVRDEAKFVETIRLARAGAEMGLLMTVGIAPTHPETGYGYVQCGDPYPPVTKVRQFHEKPNLEYAERYLADGSFLWNASMFLWRVDVFLGELQRQQPELYEGLSTVADAWGTQTQDEVLGEVWPQLKRISVDHAVMQGAADAGMVGTVRGEFGWTDVGDFDALGTVLEDPACDVADANRNIVVKDAGAQVVLHDTRDAVVVAHGGRLVAALGLQDVVVVDTPEAVLVCDRKRAQEIKLIVDDLKRRGEDGYL